MNNQVNTLIKKPSALLPIAMSLVALGVVLGHFVVYGLVHEADEGVAAHIFQLLMVFQVPIIIFFAAKYLAHFPKPALFVLALQAAAIILAFASVYFLT